RLDLVARGTTSISSKLSAHIEPITLSDIMVVNGKKLSYIGGSVSKNCFKNIKADLGKIKVASEVVKLFYEFVKPEKEDCTLFNLIEEFLNILNTDEEYDNELLLSFFTLKFLVTLGYMPEFYDCVICKNKILPDGNGINFSFGGVVCKNCASGKSNFLISENAIKVLRMVAVEDYKKINKLNIDDGLRENLIKIINSYCDYCR
ncbi:DNA repair protein RecO, partial [Candidatus Parcubacteria bacterium]|nr:DNA repair protein RecO [Candidatus Parcubacteria bacterium]